MAGLKVVAAKVHPDGNLDLDDLRAKAEKHKDNLAAFMVNWFTMAFIVNAHFDRSLILPRSVSLNLVCKMYVCLFLYCPVVYEWKGLQNHSRQWRPGLLRWRVVYLILSCIC